MTEENNKLPNLAQQAKNFIEDTAAHIANGLKQTPDQMKKDRLAICEACPKYRPQGKRCGECGCYVASKIARASSSCPIGSWGPVGPN